jgi:hypothetical protein
MPSSACLATGAGGGQLSPGNSFLINKYKKLSFHIADNIRKFNECNPHGAMQFNLTRVTLKNQNIL